MGKTTIAAVSTVLLMLGGCGATGEKKMEKKMVKEAAGTTVGECFRAGGSIEQPGGKPVCKMKDGSMKPINLK